MAGRKYEFSWELLGDIEQGRPNLGPNVPIEIYRLMQFTMRDVLEQRLGAEKTDELFYEAGKLAAAQFYDRYLLDAADFNSFIRLLQSTLRDRGMGILRVEEADMAMGRLVLTLAEDLDCSGLPEAGHEICTYDEGFLAGLLERHTGGSFKVKESDCWCTGDRTCRFTAESIG